MSGALNYGDAAARVVSQRFGGTFATEAALQALGVAYRKDGMVVAAGGRIFVFDDDSTATDRLAPSSGAGGWLPLSEQLFTRVRAATTGALAANTATGTTITADANGALGTIDGVADLAVGDTLLVQDEAGAASANNGPYVITALGAAGAKWSMTRLVTHSQADQFKSGHLVSVLEGTANGDKMFQLTTNNPIVLGTTQLAYGEVAAAAASTALEALLASTDNGKGASLVGIEDAGTLITAGTVEGALAENRALINANTAAILQKRTVTVGHADLTDAVNGEAQVVNLGAALPANAVVVGGEVNVATLFSGGGATAVKLDVGGTDIDAMAAQMDVFTGAATGALAFNPAGVHPIGKFSSEQLKLTFTPDGAHTLDGLDAGALTATVWFHVLA